ncbi:MAG: hypothetical protein AB1646_14890 [Thermodesulfobacteriota bacterium]
MTPAPEELCFIDLVRVFEGIVFDLVDNASGEIKKTIRASKGKYPFSPSAEKFVKSSEGRDISNLGHIQEILEGRLSRNLSEKLAAIVKYRNWLAHGNRFKDTNAQASLPGDRHQVLAILKDVLAGIRPIP